MFFKGQRELISAQHIIRAQKEIKSESWRLTLVKLWQINQYTVQCTVHTVETMFQNASNWIMSALHKSLTHTNCLIWVLLLSHPVLFWRASIWMNRFWTTKKKLMHRLWFVKEQNRSKIKTRSFANLFLGWKLHCVQVPGDRERKLSFSTEQWPMIGDCSLADLLWLETLSVTNLHHPGTSRSDQIKRRVWGSFR